MTPAYFTDAIIFAVLDGSRSLTPAEREYLVSILPTFEECSEELASELSGMDDHDLMQAAYGVWSDYASGQLP